MDMTLTELLEILKNEIRKLSDMENMLSYEGRERLSGYRKIMEESRFCSNAIELETVINMGALSDEEMNGARAAVRAVERVAQSEREDRSLL